MKRDVDRPPTFKVDEMAVEIDGPQASPHGAGSVRLALNLRPQFHPFVQECVTVCDWYMSPVLEGPDTICLAKHAAPHDIDRATRWKLPWSAGRT